MNHVYKIKSTNSIENSRLQLATLEPNWNVKNLHHFEGFDAESFYSKEDFNNYNGVRSSFHSYEKKAEKDVVIQDTLKSSIDISWHQKEEEEAKQQDISKCIDFKSDDSCSLYGDEHTSREEFSQPKKAKGKWRQMLSLRHDVMNKNLFRALRREWKVMFDMFLNSSNLAISKKQKVFLPNLEQFTEHLLSETTVRWERFSEFNTKDFETYLGILTNYWAMKKLKNGREREKLDKVYSVLYSYSHVKFNEFISIPEIKALVMIIWERQGIQSLIESNGALSANKEKYEAHIGRLLKSFN